MFKGCSCVYSEYASPEPSEEEQLRAIWSEVHVGANGFLDRYELALVCEHIGMDSMNDQVHNLHIVNCVCVCVFTCIVALFSCKLCVCFLFLCC